MKITYTARKVNLKDNFKNLCEKKLSKFDKIFSSEAAAKVVVTLEKNRQTVEITINDNGMIFRAEDTKPEMNEALDKVIYILGRQLRKNKTKLSRKIRSGGIDEVFAEADEPVVDETEYEVRVKSIPVKPLSVDEAILQMNMLGHSFFVFTNAETSRTNVVYKRNNGAYGLLEPDEDI